MGDIEDTEYGLCITHGWKKKLRQKKCRNIPNSLSNCQQIKDTWTVQMKGFSPSTQKSVHLVYGGPFS